VLDMFRILAGIRRLCHKAPRGVVQGQIKVGGQVGQIDSDLLPLVTPNLYQSSSSSGQM
jgi:hypothetical protein